MPHEYRIKDQHAVYFITTTVHQWVDVFTRKEYVDILLDSLKFCKRERTEDLWLGNHAVGRPE